MDAVFLKLLNMSLTASWIVLAVLILRLLLKRAPKWINCLLWGVVGLRLIFPFSIESLFSLIPSAEPLPSDLPMTQTPAIDSGFEVIDQVVNPIIYDSFAPTPTNSANPMQIAIAVAAIVWLCGLVAMIVYGVISYLRLRLRVRASICQDGNVYFCDDIDSPFILGVIRPRIYLPSGMTQEQMGYVIGHERAHLRRLDHIWKPVGFVLLCLHWFNPLLWVAYVLLCRDIEKACDEKVIRDMDDESKKGYSETLVACSVHRRAVMACPLAFGEVGVKDRIKSVLNYKKPAFWVILVAVVALVVTGVCFLTDPKSDTDADEALLRISNQEIRYTHIAYTAMTSFHLPPDSPYLCLDLYINGETLYVVGSDGGLMESGTLTPVTLTRQNFSRYFLLDNTLGQGPYAKELLRNNKFAWEIHEFSHSEEIYHHCSMYLLLQKDGTIYVVCGKMLDGQQYITSVFGFEPAEPTFSQNSGTTADGINWFVGTILEIDDSSFLVEPAEGTPERKSADRIMVSRATSNDEDDLVMPYLRKGEEIYVYYTGGIAESYPARINKVRMIVPKWATVVEQPESSIFYDIDNDGQKEYCVIGYGPQEDGKYIVGIRAWNEDATVLEYSNYFLSPYIYSSLIMCSDGTLWVGGGTAWDVSINPSSEIPRQITVADGKMLFTYPYAYLTIMTYDEVVAELGEPLGEPTKQQGHYEGKAYTIYMYEFPFNEEWNLRIDFNEKNIDVGVKRQYVYHYSLTPKE